MVEEILAVLKPKPGEIAVDCTLGYGGHAHELLKRISPEGKVIGLDADPIELPKTLERFRNLGFGEDVFLAHRSNFAGLPKVLAQVGLTGVDMVLADLGVSSMQLDNPARGFSTKFDGPLDMRMNPERGQSAADFLKKISAEALEHVLVQNSDEPYAKSIAQAIAGKKFETCSQLTRSIEETLQGRPKEKVDISMRRVFQALRIAVNDEFSALDTLLRHLPSCLNPGGRVAILTFHSGEDRRVKNSFEAGVARGVYSAINQEVIRASPEERRDNPRSTSAKLRWAIRPPTLEPKSSESGATITF